MPPAAAPGTSAASVATAGCSTPSVGMITLNMNEASVAQTRKNAAVLSPCHNQNSRINAVFCGAARGGALHDVNCSRLCSLFVPLVCYLSLHEPSILSCPQAPAGDPTAPHAGGCAPFS